MPNPVERFAARRHPVRAAAQTRDRKEGQRLLLSRMTPYNVYS